MSLGESHPATDVKVENLVVAVVYKKVGLVQALIPLPGRLTVADNTLELVDLKQNSEVINTSYGNVKSISRVYQNQGKNTGNFLRGYRIVLLSGEKYDVFFAGPASNPAIKIYADLLKGEFVNANKDFTDNQQKMTDRNQIKEAKVQSKKDEAQFVSMMKARGVYKSQLLTLRGLVGAIATIGIIALVMWKFANR